MGRTLHELTVKQTDTPWRVDTPLPLQEGERLSCVLTRIPLDRLGTCAILRDSMRPIVIADAVREWRQTRGLSQRALAERAGVGYVLIARLELGQTDPRLSTLERLAEALGVSVPELFTPPSKAKRPARKRARGK